jgi:hypothetical protein
MKVWKLLPLLPALLAFSAVLNTSRSSATNPARDFSYESKFYKIQLADSLPFIKYFSVDALSLRRSMRERFRDHAWKAG